MSDKATIQAEFTGADKVASEAKKVGGALEGAKKSGEGAARGISGVTGQIKGIGDAAEGIKDALSPKALFGGLIGGGIAAAIGMGVKYLAEGRDKAIDFNKATSELARRGGTGYAELRAQIEGVEVATLKGKDEQIAYIDALDRMNYSGEGARQSLAGIASAAQGAGRSMQEFVSGAAALHEMFGEAKNVTGELDRAAAAADKFGAKGGAKAFLDTLGALRPILATLGPMSDDAAHRLENLTGQASARYKPETARRVMGGLLGALQANAPAIERSLGVKIRDENGQISDPEAALAKVQTYVRKRSSSKTEALRRLEGSGFGQEGAAFLLSNTFGAEGPSSQDVAYQEALRGAKLDQYKQTDEGARELRDMKGEQRQRAAGQKALAATDAVGAAWDEGMWGNGGAGRPAQNVIDAGAKEIGEQAIREGGFTPEIVKRAGGAESPTMRGAVGYLGGRGDLPPELAAQVQSAMQHFGIDEKKLGAAVGREVADALQRTPLQVRLPEDPNRPRGS